jgi:hypothetical protein
VPGVPGRRHGRRGGSDGLVGCHEGFSSALVSGFGPFARQETFLSGEIALSSGRRPDERRDSLTGSLLGGWDLEERPELLTGRLRGGDSCPARPAQLA